MTRSRTPPSSPHARVEAAMTQNGRILANGSNLESGSVVDIQASTDSVAEPQKRPELSSLQTRQRREAPLRSSVYAKSDDVLRLRYRRVRRLVRKVRQQMPWLDPADEPAMRAWAELEILAAGMFLDLTNAGFLSESGEPRRLLTEYRQYRHAQLAYERELGMTPASRSALQVDDSRARALDISAQLAEGRKLREAADGRLKGD